MSFHLLRARLRDIAALFGRTDLVDLQADEKLLPESIRNELTAHIYSKELELSDLQNALGELGDLEAMAASFAGGIGDDGSDSSDQGDHQ